RNDDSRHGQGGRTDQDHSAQGKSGGPRPQGRGRRRRLLRHVVQAGLREGARRGRQGLRGERRAHLRRHQELSRPERDDARLLGRLERHRVQLHQPERQIDVWLRYVVLRLRSFRTPPASFPIRPTRRRAPTRALREMERAGNGPRYCTARIARAIISCSPTKFARDHRTARAEMAHKKNLLSGQRIYPDPIRGGMTVDRLIDDTFLAYNGGRLQKACRLLTEKMLQEDVTIGLSLSGALTPAGVGRSCIIPLIQSGFVDWIASTGANLYHDTHYGLGMSLHRGSHEVDDALLRREGVIRIYDVLFDYNVLLDTDNYLRAVMAEKA